MKYLNKVKMIKSVYGDLGHCTNSRLTDYGNLDKMNIFIEDMVSKEEDINSRYIRFLMRQEYKLAKFIYYKLKKKSEEINVSFSTVDHHLYRNIESVIEAEIYCSNAGSGYEGMIQEFFHFLKKNPSQFRNLNRLLKKASLNQNYARVISLENLLNMSHNDIFNNMGDDDILTCVTRSKSFDIDFKVITKDEINILFSEDYHLIPDLKESNLSIVNILKPYLKSSDVNLLSKAPALFDDFDATKYLIEVLLENNKKQVLSLIIKACKKGYVKDGKDITLIANKIKYGEEFKTIIDFGYLIAGSRDIKFKDSELSRLISVKKVLSKNFYRFLLNNDELLCTTIKNVNNDIFMKVAKCLELGQLNESEYRDLLNSLMYVGIADSGRLWDFDFGFKLTYQEFNELFKITDNKIFEHVVKFKGIKSSARLLKIKELKELYDNIDSKTFIFSSKEVLELLGDKSIKEEMRNNNPLALSDMAEYLNYMVLNKRHSISSIQDYRKYILADKFIGIDNVNDNDIDDIIMNCNVTNKIMEFLNLSEDFKAQYSDEIFNFLISEEFELVYGYYKNRNVDSSQLDSLALIAKSLIANRYEDLKFVKEDVMKEAGADISDDEFDNWKRTDEVSYKNYIIRDESDFKVIMKMGEVPVRSCMHYASGMYSRCLLSNFDTTKKMLTIHKNGKYVGRAIIRLTKMSDNPYVKEIDGLSFIDVDNTSLNEAAVDISNNKNNEEQLILFLEKQYTTLDREDLNDLFDTLVGFLKDKAESIGAKLVVSRSYEDIASRISRKYDFEEKHVFITASKNGYQYLDSFDGSTTKAYCYKKGKVLIY